ncbi:MAG: hypothetical protein GWN93_26815 [Deltaproteobacteria bacterium]|nr:hypothetical protein [Deltaproteobacteria bacterium]
MTDYLDWLAQRREAFVVMKKKEDSMSVERAVFKYDLDGMLNCWFHVDLPVGHEILDVDMQGPPYSKPEKPKLWALVDPFETKMVSREFLLAFTGENFNMVGYEIYIGSMVSSEGFRIHVFMRPVEENNNAI